MIWQESEAAATVGGIPSIIKTGVRRNPPLTPKSPERKPTIAPAPTKTRSLLLIPATGRRTHIKISFRLKLRFSGLSKVEGVSMNHRTAAQPSQTFDKHVGPERPQHHNVRQRDNQIGFPQRP